MSQVQHPQQRYRVLERLESGGMAEVFAPRAPASRGSRSGRDQARPPSPEREEALHLDVPRRGAARRAALALELRQVFDIGVGDNAYFIVMEFVDGADLKAVIDYLKEEGQGQFPSRSPRSSAGDLRRAHLRARAHRPRGQAAARRAPRHVSAERAHHQARRGEDRGLRPREGVSASSRRASPASSRASSATSRPRPPRQGVGRPRTDIFAVGIILWELLAGRRLFMGDTDFADGEAGAAGRDPVASRDASQGARGARSHPAARAREGPGRSLRLGPRAGSEISPRCSTSGKARQRVRHRGARPQARCASARSAAPTRRRSSTSSSRRRSSSSRRSRTARSRRRPPRAPTSLCASSPRSRTEASRLPPRRWPPNRARRALVRPIADQPPPPFSPGPRPSDALPRPSAEVAAQKKASSPVVYLVLLVVIAAAALGPGSEGSSRTDPHPPRAAEESACRSCALAYDRDMIGDLVPSARGGNGSLAQHWLLDRYWIFAWAILLLTLPSRGLARRRGRHLARLSATCSSPGRRGSSRAAARRSARGCTSSRCSRSGRLRLRRRCTTQRARGHRGICRAAGPSRSSRSRRSRGCAGPCFRWGSP
jgi:serine/threonine protein kinase